MVAFGNPVKGRIGPVGHPDPSSGMVVTSPFGPRGDSGNHDGLDIDNGGPSGDPILAMRSGRVYQAFTDQASGGAKIVRIDHGDGWTTGYAHLDRIDVSVGEQVDEGEQIGTLGSTGWVTGPHLHMDTSYQNERRDPWPLLRQNQEEEVDMEVPDGLSALTYGDLPAGTQLHSPEPGKVARSLGEDARVQVYGRIAGAKEWTIDGVTNDDWYYIGAAGEAYYVPTARFPESLALTSLGEDVVDYPKSEPVDPCSQAAFNADRANMRATLIAGLALLAVVLVVLILVVVYAT